MEPTDQRDDALTDQDDQRHEQHEPSRKLGLPMRKVKRTPLERHDSTGGTRARHVGGVDLELPTPTTTQAAISPPVWSARAPARTTISSTSSTARGSNHSR